MGRMTLGSGLVHRVPAVELKSAFPPPPMKISRAMIPLIRAAGLAAIAAWGCYMAAMFRTSEWGYDDPGRRLLGSLLAFGLFALPVSFVPLIGLPWRRQCAVLALMAVGCVATVEGFARGQEHLLVRRLGERPREDHVETRWWPFEHHSLGFARGQWWGCD